MPGAGFLASLVEVDFAEYVWLVGGHDYSDHFVFNTMNMTNDGRNEFVLLGANTAPIAIHSADTISPFNPPSERTKLFAVKIHGSKRTYLGRLRRLISSSVSTRGAVHHC